MKSTILRHSDMSVLSVKARDFDNLNDTFELIITLVIKKIKSLNNNLLYCVTMSDITY